MHSTLAISALVIGIVGVLAILCILLLGKGLRKVLGRKSQKPEPVKYTSPSCHQLSNPRDSEGHGNNDDQQEEERVVGSESKDETRGNKTTGGSWKFTLYLGSIASLMVLLFNTGFAAWAATKHTGSDSTGVLFTGQCRKAQNINTAFHLVINILATLVLGASSYGMVRVCQT